MSMGALQNLQNCKRATERSHKGEREMEREEEKVGSGGGTRMVKGAADSGADDG
jgi:hypothetical protein